MHLSQVSITDSTSSSTRTPASSISAITFDESTIHLLNTSENRSFKKTKEQQSKPSDKVLRNGIMESTEGSLYKRILNGLNDMKETESSKKTKPQVIHLWKQVNDPKSDRVYFYNRRTKETSWTLPAGAMLSSRKKKTKANSEETSTNESIDIIANQTSVGSEDESFLLSRRKTLDENIQKDHVESYLILERCKKLTESINQSERRRFFFPDLSADQESDEKIDKKHREDDEKKPGNDFSSDDTNVVVEIDSLHFFCLFCGLRVESSLKLEFHFRNSCRCFKKVQIGHPVEYKNLHDILLNFWKNNDRDNKENTIPQENCTIRDENIMKINQHDDSSNPVRAFGTDITPLPTITTCISNHESITNTEHSYSSDEESTIFSQARSFSRSLCIPNKNQQKKIESSSSVNQIEGPSWPSSGCCCCAFCNQVFSTGAKLSSHLLRCKKRQSSQQKRIHGISM